MYNLSGNSAGYILTNVFNLQCIQTIPKALLNKSSTFLFKISLCLKESLFFRLVITEKTILVKATVYNLNYWNK